MTAPAPARYRTAQDKVTRSGVGPVLALLAAVPATGTPMTDAQWLRLLALMLPGVLAARSTSRDLAGELYATLAPSGRAPDVPVKPYDATVLDRGLSALSGVPVREKLTDPARHGQGVVEGASVAARHIEMAGRDYTRQAAYADEDAIGWARVARGARTCSFCLLLISRGPAYTSGARAGLNPDGTMNAWHIRCDCQAVPVFDPLDWPGRDQYLRAEALYAASTGDVSGVEKLKAFRRAVEQESPAVAPAASSQDDSVDLDALPVPPKALPEMSDDEIDAALTAAIEADDWDYFEQVEAEANARQEAKDRKATESAARSERRREQKDRERRAQLDLMVELIEQGVSEADAYAEAYGVSTDQAKRQFAIESLRSSGYKGSSFEKLARQSFTDHVAREWLRAEGDCRGEMRNALGERLNIDDRGLFTGPVSRVKKYASEELLEWFEINGRPTFDEWVATLLGDRTAAETARKSGEVSRDR